MSKHEIAILTAFIWALFWSGMVIRILLGITYDKD